MPSTSFNRVANALIFSSSPKPAISTLANESMIASTSNSKVALPIWLIATPLYRMISSSTNAGIAAFKPKCFKIALMSPKITLTSCSPL